ncbi:MAG: ABC transporter permease [Alphaproteobacteria bacterium]|nr:ABC transporter permease [Alphaproteobacteria bacterium]
MNGRRLPRLLWRAVVAAFVAAFYVFLFAPLVVVVGASFDGGEHAFLNFPPRHLSLAWYLKIPGRYFETLWVSLQLGVVAAACSGVLGVMAALALARGRLPGAGLMAALFRAPLQIPVIVTGFAFLQLFYLASAAGGVPLVGSFAGLAIAHVFITLPYVIGTTAAILQRVNPSLEEAAISLGATRWRTFRRVTLPAILPGVYAGALYAFIVSFGDVPVSMFLAGSRYTTFPVEMFYGMELNFDPAILAMSTLILVGSFAAIWAVQRFLGLNTLLGTGAGS